MGINKYFTCDYFSFAWEQEDTKGNLIGGAVFFKDQDGYQYRSHVLDLQQFTDLKLDFNYTYIVESFPIPKDPLILLMQDLLISRYVSRQEYIMLQQYEREMKARLFERKLNKYITNINQKDQND